MLKIILLFLLIPYVLCAEEINIFGEANTASHTKKDADFSFFSPNVEYPYQPPLNQEKQILKIQKKSNATPVNSLKEIHQFLPQNPKPFSISPQQQKNEIENTLYESDGRIYDVQSFPLKDIKTITKPNIEPTISTYPAY